MLFESKRLLELAGLPVEGASSVLTEGVEQIKEFSSNDGVTVKDEEDEEGEEEEEAAKECKEEKEIREAVRAEIEHMWASGEVFGTRSKSKKGQVTLGFMGVGFKK